MVALCEANDDLARAKAAALMIPKAYGSVDALLADKDVEVVHNCTPNHVHFAISKKIMAAGKHVISEKPLAMTTRESNELVALAAKAGVVNAIDFNYRYYPLVQEAKARGGSIIAITTAGDTTLRDILGDADSLISVPATSPLLMPVVLSIPLQLLSYYIAVRRGCDVDQPRNLAKSVTVE